MNYNSPFIKMLETVANMFIVSFLWFVFALPVVTIIPSSAALYHTTNKVIFGPGRGNGVFKDFFDSYKLNLIPGIKLNMIAIVAALFIAEGLWTGYQFYRVSIWGMLYMMLGVIITAVVVTTLVYVPPVLSRFVAPVTSIIRIAVYFAIRKPFRSLAYLLLFLFMIYSIQAFPLALVIVPGLYADLVRTYLEKDMNQFIAENGLEEIAEKEDIQESEEEETDSMVDIEKKLSEDRKGKK